MLDSHRLTIKLSTLRSSLLDLSRKDAPTDEDRAAIVNFETQLGHTEAQLRAALLSEGDSTPSDGGENRALDRLVSRANLGSIFQCAVEQRAPGGPESELQQHFGVAINCIPLRLLEQRAVATVPASVSSTPAATGQAATLLPIFSLGDTAFLNVSQIRAEPGSSAHPVLDTRADIHGPFTDSSDAAETTASFSASLLEPGRISSGFSFLRTDSVKFPGMADALRQALSLGLSEALDQKMVAQIVTDVSQTGASAVDSYSTYLSRGVYGQVSGREASGENELKLLVGAATFEDMSELYRNASTGERNVVDTVRSVTGGLRVSPHIPAKSGENQDFIVRKGVATGCGLSPLGWHPNFGGRTERCQSRFREVNRHFAWGREGDPNERVGQSTSASRIGGSVAQHSTVGSRRFWKVGGGFKTPRAEQDFGRFHRHLRIHSRGPA